MCSISKEKSSEETPQSITVSVGQCARIARYVTQYAMHVQGQSVSRRRTIVELAHVKVFQGVDAGDGAARHVAHIVHAGLHRAQPHCPQTLHRSLLPCLQIIATADMKSAMAPCLHTTPGMPIRSGPPAPLQRWDTCRMIMLDQQTVRKCAGATPQRSCRPRPGSCRAAGR